MNKPNRVYLYFRKVLGGFFKSPTLEQSNCKDLFETVITMVKEQGKDTAKLIRTWLNEPDGKEKAAVFLIALDSDGSAKDVFTYLTEGEMEMLVLEIIQRNVVSVEQKNAVFHEFLKRLAAKQFISLGGVDCARDLFEESLGKEKISDIFSSYEPFKIRPFDFIRRVDPAKLFNFIQDEYPQTIAVVLAHLEPDRASVILENLPHETQIDVTRRMSTMDSASPEIIREIERVLEKKLSSFSSEDYFSVGGVESTAEILRLLDHSAAKQITEALKEDYSGLAELAEEIKKCMVENGQEMTG